MHKIKYKISTYIKSFLLYSFLILLSIIMIAPFIWMISTSLKETGAIFTLPPEIIPSNISLNNYKEILERIPFLNFTINSIIITVSASIGQVVSCSLAAYAFARMKFKGSKILYYILLSTMMIPTQVTIIPTFIIMNKLGLVDTHLALILPACLGGAFGTFLLRQFFSSIPKDLEDAAKIDGCGSLRIFYHIFLVQSKPVLATLFIFAFMFYWNDLLSPVIFLSSLDKMTLTVGLASIQGINYDRFDLMMAGSFLSMIPILILFVFAQKFFIKSIVSTGIKE